MGVLLAGVVGVVLGAVLVTAAVWRWRRRFSESGAAVEHDAAAGPALCRRLLDLMDPAVIVVATDDSVVLANPAARALGIVRSGRVLVHDLLALARTVRAGRRRPCRHQPAGCPRRLGPPTRRGAGRPVG